MPRGPVYIGTSGWSYQDWFGRFYPAKLRAKDCLEFYSRHFNTIEVNLSFYRLPTQGAVEGWNRELPPDFHLVLKGSRTITHMKKLRDCEPQIERFFDRVGQLRNLKVVLWQLPPNLRKDAARLDDFLSKLPGPVRHAVEFRHGSWWDGEVAAVLARRRAAFVAVSSTLMPDAIYPTTDFLYVRFHGLESSPTPANYSRKELESWAERLDPHLRRGLALYAFFNNDHRAYAVHNAQTLLELLHVQPAVRSLQGNHRFP